MTWQTMYIENIGFPDRGDQIGQRNSQYIYCKGINLNMTLTNNNQNIPGIMHVALVQEKDTISDPTDLRTDFFRETGSGSIRSTDFINWSAGDSFSFVQQKMPINSDKLRVITHQKYYLAPKTTNNGHNDHGSWFKTTKKYFPIKRRLAFDGTTDFAPWQPFYLLIWWTTISGNDYNSGTNQKGFTYNIKADVLFRSIV